MPNYFDKTFDYTDELEAGRVEFELRQKAQKEAEEKESLKAQKENEEEVSKEEALESFNLSSSSQKPVPQPVSPDAPLYEAEVNQQTEDPSTFGLGENIIEARNAIAKGGLDAIESTITAPERLTDAAKGEEIGDPDYKLDWDPMQNTPTPLVRTWWGGLLEDVSHYGSFGLGLIVGTAGSAVGLGATGVGMTSAGIAALLSNKHDGHNLSGEIVKKVPEMGLVLGPLATKDSDHPLLKKLKTVTEEMSLAGLFDKILGKLFGAAGADKAIARNKNVELQIIEKGKQEFDEAIEMVTVRDISNQQGIDGVVGQKALPSAGQTGRPTVPFRGHMNKPVADPWQGSPNSTNTPYDIHDQLNKIDKDPTAASGSTDSPLTPAQAERMAQENGMAEKVMQEKAQELIGDVRYRNLVNEAKATGKTFREVFEPAYGRYMRMMGRNVNGMEPDEFWKPIMDETSARSGGPESVDFWSPENVVTADLVNSALFKQLRDLSIGVREMKDVIDVFDTDGPMKTIADRLVVGLANVKKARWMQGSQFRKLQGLKGKAKREAYEASTAARDEAFTNIDESVRDTVNMAMQFIGKSGNEKIFDGIIEAMSLGNQVENWTDLDNFMRKKLHGFTNENITLRELTGVMVNSILSGIKTPVRALWGTGSVAFMQPMGRAIGSVPGAIIKGDATALRGHLAAMNAYANILPEAFDVFKKRMDAYWSGDFADMRTRYSESVNNDEHWAAMDRWVEMNGTLGDKASFSIAWTARKLNDNRMLSYSPRLMASIDDTYKVIMARARAREKATVAALEMKKSGDLFDVQPSDIKNLENKFYNELLDAEGNIDLSKDSFLEKAFKEATLTEDLQGFSKGLDNLMGNFPLSRPFYLFARTGINGLDITFKHTPGLGLLHKKHLAIMTADPNNLESVAKYGIQTIEDLNSEKALITGRQAIGTAVTFMGAQKYMGGELTGNGPSDPGLKEAWVKAGWQERSIKIGGAWISYDQFEPFSMILASMADIGDNLEYMGPQWVENTYKQQSFALGAALTSKSYLQGLGNLVDLFKGEPGSMGRIVANTMNNSVPLAGLRNDFGKLITPYQRELVTGISDSIRNRNLGSEQLTQDPLSIKYDMLNGKPMKDWPFWQRMVNTVLPINFSIDKMTPGRKLFLESGYDARMTVYYGPNGENLTSSAEVRSLYMKAIGDQNLEAKFDELARRPSVKNSMNEMRSDLNNGRREIDPMTAYTHNILLSSAIDEARKKAWRTIADHPSVVALKAEQNKVEKATRDRRNSLRENVIPRILEINNYQ